VIPTQEVIINSLLILLLPGFVSLKIWEQFFPKIPSQKQESFDKIATYFSLTLIIYLVTLTIFYKYITNPYLIALIATVIAIILGLTFGILKLLFNTCKVFEGCRKWLDNIFPSNDPIWHKAFYIDRKKEEGITNSNIFVKVGVFMKNGSIFAGEIDSYPLEDNIEDTKDFIIKGVTLFKSDGKKITYNPDFRLLLNQRDVDAIVYQYVTLGRIQKKEKLYKL
jgi:hypothetical protein